MPLPLHPFVRQLGRSVVEVIPLSGVVLDSVDDDRAPVNSVVPLVADTVLPDVGTENTVVDDTEDLVPSLVPGLFTVVNTIFSEDVGVVMGVVVVSSSSSVEKVDVVGSSVVEVSGPKE